MFLSSSGSLGMVKSSSSSMNGTCSQQHKVNSRKRKRSQKRKQKGIDGDLSADKQNSTDNSGIDKLPDDMLIAILSRMSLEEAARTSVLSRRWKYLWMFAPQILCFDAWKTPTGPAMKRKKFKSWVNGFMKFYQPRHVDSLIIRFSKIRSRYRPISSNTYRAIDSWIYFAIQKEAQCFELNLSPRGSYEFPNIEKLISLSQEVNSPFRSLRSLRLVDIKIKDEVVRYFLASCPHLEQLCIRASDVTKNLQFVDPLPNLKVLEITKCCNIQSLEISAASLVSFTYEWSKINLLFKKIPNLCELTLGEAFCDSIIFEPNEHSSYSVQLVELVLRLQTPRHCRAIIAPTDLPQLCSLKRLELKVGSPVGRSLLFFTSLIKASPQLHEFSIEIFYRLKCWDMDRELMLFPAVSAAEAVKFDHKNFKVVEMARCVGCSSEEEFLLQLCKIASSLERVAIDTQSYYYRMTSFRTTRIESKERVKHLASTLRSTFPQEIQFVVK